jgi:hypothetical protein
MVDSVQRLDFRAMNCGMTACLVTSDVQAARERLEAVRDWMFEVEAHLSRFLPQNELRVCENTLLQQAVPRKSVVYFSCEEE